MEHYSQFFVKYISSKLKRMCVTSGTMSHSEHIILLDITCNTYSYIPIKITDKTSLFVFTANIHFGRICIINFRDKSRVINLGFKLERVRNVNWMGFFNNFFFTFIACLVRFVEGAEQCFDFDDTL